MTGTLTKSVSLDGVDVTRDIETAATGTYTGHEFFDLVSAATDADLGGLLSDMSTSGELSFDLEGLARPDVAYTDAEGRYILAEFVAIDEGVPLTFTASQGDLGLGGTLTPAAERTIERITSDTFVEVFDSSETPVL